MSVRQSCSGLDSEPLGFPLTHGWVAYVIGLYCMAGLCWLPVVWLQMRMQALARDSDSHGKALAPIYRVYARIWFWLGVPAFLSLVVVFWLMVAKPG